jgi:hemerythrin-like domain-containing protein
MNPTETLKHEHQVILLVLGAAEREAQLIQRTGKVDTVKVGQMVEFFRNFADRCHHAKEENLLFVKMQERGMPVQGGPIGVMLQEHVQGRSFVRATGDALSRAGAGDGAAVASVADNLSGFVRLLRAHIYKEDNILYPMADQIFSPQDQQALAAEFDRVEAEEMGEGVHERYHELAHRLAEG